MGTIRFTPVITFFILIIYSHFSLAEPSFNCSKATTKIEQAICEIGWLSEYDNLMGKMYRELKHIKPVKKTQSQWLKTRNTRCSSAEFLCLAKQYQARLLELDQYFDPTTPHGKYITTGGDRENTITVSSSGQLLQVNLLGAGRRGWTCEFEGTGQLKDHKVIAKNKISSEAFVKIVFHNKLIEVSAQGLPGLFCGAYAQVDGFYFYQK